MSTVTLTAALQSVARLIPVRATNLRGDYAAVCTPASSVPTELQADQQRRTDYYMETGSRTEPTYAPRYYVTSFGHLVAWVTLDGRVRIAPVIGASRRADDIRRHREAVLAAWPDRFTMDEMGDPIL